MRGFGCQNRVRAGALLCGRCESSKKEPLRSCAKVIDRRHPELLIECALSEDDFVRRRLIENEHIPVSLVCHFARSDDPEMRFEAALHPKAPTCLLEHLAEDSSEEVLVGLAMREDLPASLWHQLLWSGLPDVVSELLKHQTHKPTTAMWQQLLTESDIAVRMAVGKSRHLPEKHQISLAESELDFEVLRVFARACRNRKAINALIERIIAAPAEATADCLTSLLYNERLREKDIDRLLPRASRMPHWRALLSQTVTSAAALQQIPKVKELAYDLAAHPSASPELLDDLAKQFKTVRVRHLISINQNALPETLRLLHRHQSRSIHQGLASNPSTPEDILRTLAHDMAYPHVGALLVKNPSTPLPLFNVLADTDDDRTLKALAVSERTPAGALDRIESKTRHVRLAVAQHPAASGDMLRELAEDKDWEIRWSVIGNDNTTSDVIVMMAIADPELGLRRFASEVLQQRKADAKL